MSSIRFYAPPEKQRFKNRIHLFYSTHVPSMMDNVDKALTINAPEQKIFSSLYTKYKVDPKSEEEAARRKGFLPKNHQPFSAAATAAVTSTSTPTPAATTAPPAGNTAATTVAAPADATTTSSQEQKTNNQTEVEQATVKIIDKTEDAGSPDPRPPSSLSTSQSNNNKIPTPKMTPKMNTLTPSNSGTTALGSSINSSSTAKTKILLRDLPEQEKERFRQRFTLFYQRHALSANNNNTPATKIQDNLRILFNSTKVDDANEDAVMNKLCTKYNISKEQELLESGSKGLLPSSSSASSGLFNKNATPNTNANSSSLIGAKPLPAAAAAMSSGSNSNNNSSPNLISPPKDSGIDTRPPTPNVNNNNNNNNNKTATITPSSSAPPTPKITNNTTTTTIAAPMTDEQLQQHQNKKHQEIPMKEYSDLEKERFKRRLTLFYEQHAPNMLAELDTNLRGIFKTANLESTLMKMICNKYKVELESEEKRAREGNCLPGMIMNKNNTNTPTSNNKPIIITSKAATPIQSNMMTDKNNTNDNKTPNNSSSATTPPPPSAASTSSSERVVLKNFSPEEKNRLKRRLQLFYARFAPAALDRLDDNLIAIFKSESTEEVLIDKITAKYHVDTEIELEMAKKENVLPAENKKNLTSTVEFTVTSSRNTTPKIGSLPGGNPSSTATFAGVGDSRRGSLLQIEGGQKQVNSSSFAPLLLKNYSATEQERLKNRMAAFYKKHQPESLKKLDDTIRIVCGPKSSQTEEMVIQKLCAKYKIEESQEQEDAKSLGLLPTTTTGGNDKLEISANYNDNNNTFMMKNYSEDEKARFSKRLRSFYEKHAPENLEKLDTNLEICFKSERVEAGLMSNACKKYNVDPDLEIEEARLNKTLPSWQQQPIPSQSDIQKNINNSSTNNNAEESSSTPPLKDYPDVEKARFKRRFVLFYQNHTPPEILAKTDETLAMLLRSDNIESNIFKTLCKKYEVKPETELAEARQEGVLLGDSTGPEISVKTGLSVDLARITLKDLPPVERDRVRQRLSLLYTNHRKDPKDNSYIADIGKMMVSETMTEEEAIFTACIKMNVETSIEISEARAAGVLKSKGGSKTPSAVGTPKTPKLTTTTTNQNHSNNNNNNNASLPTKIKTPIISTLNADVQEPVGVTVPDLSKSMYEQNNNHQKKTAATTANESFSRTQSDALVERAKEAGIHPPQPTLSQSPSRIERAWKDRLTNEDRALEYFNAMKNIQKEDVDPIEGLGFDPENPIAESKPSQNLPQPVIVGTTRSRSNSNASNNNKDNTLPENTSFGGLQQHASASALDRLTAAALSGSPIRNNNNTTSSSQHQSPTFGHQYQRTDETSSLTSVSGHTSSVLKFGVEGGMSTHLQFTSPNKRLVSNNGDDQDNNNNNDQYDTMKRRDTLPFNDNNNNNYSPVVPIEPIPDDVATASLASYDSKAQQNRESDDNNNKNKNDAMNLVSLSPPSRKNSVAAAGNGGAVFSVGDYTSYEKSRLRSRIKLFYKKHAPDGLSKLDENIQKTFDPKNASSRRSEAEIIKRMCEKYNVKDEVEEEDAKKAGIYAPPVSAPENDHHDDQQQQQRSRASSVASSTGSSVFRSSAAVNNKNNNSNDNSTIKTHLPPLPKYSKEEKERFRNRVILFYKNHYPKGMEKLDENLKKAFTFDANYEELLIRKMCEKYNVDRKVEYMEAKGKELAHPPPTSANNSRAASSQQNTPREFNLAKTLETSRTKPLVCPMTPATHLHLYSKQERIRFKNRLTLFYENFAQAGLPKVESNVEKLLAPPTATKKPTTEEETIAHICEKYNVNYYTQEIPLARKNNCFERVSVETPLSVKNLSDENKERVKKRLGVFYKRYSPENLENVDRVAGFASTEEQIIRKVCQKYRVPSQSEEVVAKAHGLWAPPASILLDELLLQYALRQKQNDEDELLSTTNINNHNNSNQNRNYDSLGDFLVAPSPIHNLNNQNNTNNSPSSSKAHRRHSSHYDESGIRPETLYSGASPDTLFSKFLQLSQPRSIVNKEDQNTTSTPKKQQQQQNIRRNFQDYCSPVTTTPIVPRDVTNFATPDLDKYFAGISPTPGNPSAEDMNNNNNSNFGIGIEEPMLSPRAETAQKLLSALMDQLDIDVEGRNSEDAMIQAAWGQKMTPERYKAHRRQLLENKIPRNVFPISTPDNKQQQQQNRRQESSFVSADVSAVIKPKPKAPWSSFMDVEDITTPPPTTSSTHNTSSVLSPPRRLEQSRKQQQQQSFTDPTTINRSSVSQVSAPSRKVIVGNQVFSTTSIINTTNEGINNNNNSRIPQPGPVYDDELVQDSINERMSSFLPSGQEVELEERMNRIRRSKSRSLAAAFPTSSKSPSMLRDFDDMIEDNENDEDDENDQEHQKHPFAFSFHTVGSLPCPSAELACPVCGEELESLVREETSSKAAEAFDPTTLATALKTGPRVRFYGDQQDGGSYRAGSSSSASDVFTRPRRSVSQGSAGMNFQTVTSHLDRCIKRRRSFEEQIFDTNANPVRDGGSKTNFERNAEEAKKKNNEILPNARASILRAASNSSSILSSSTAATSSQKAHVLLSYLGELTAFNQEAKKFTNDLDRHRTKSTRFFQQVEMYRQNHHQGDHATERNKQRTMNSNVYDQFLGMEVELFEEGTRLVHEKERLQKKSVSLLKKLQLPCPMGDKCEICLEKARSSRLSTPNQSRRGSPEKGSRSSSIVLRNNNNNNNDESKSALGFLTHSDVPDHSMFCWKAKFNIERCVPKYESFSNSHGFYHDLGMKVRKTSQSGSANKNNDDNGNKLLLIDSVPQKKGGTISSQVDKSTETLWTLLAKAAPALVTRASNAPLKVLEQCVELLDDDQEDLDEFFRASGMKPKKSMGQQTHFSYNHHDDDTNNDGQGQENNSPRSIATTKLRRQLAQGAAFRGANAEISRILRECVGLGDEERFYTFDERDGRELPLVKLIFVRTYDQEVIDGNLPIWKCWWLDFNVFIV